MRAEDKVVVASLILGLTVWVVDSALTYFFIHTTPFWDLLIVDVPRHDLYARSLVLVCFLIFGILVCRTLAQQKQALEEIRVLRGILPICSYCKKIRSDRGYWQEVEAYIRERSDAEFSHGICPDCLAKLSSTLPKSPADSEAETVDEV
ncbi:MAG: hypothetical protein KAW89_01710 [Armatimonadetes bacterium]|nr:hypothetical protein [Armatimonadota bacterium]